MTYYQRERDIHCAHVIIVSHSVVIIQVHTQRVGGVRHREDEAFIPLGIELSTAASAPRVSGISSAAYR